MGPEKFFPFPKKVLPLKWAFFCTILKKIISEWMDKEKKTVGDRVIPLITHLEFWNENPNISQQDVIGQDLSTAVLLKS